MLQNYFSGFHPITQTLLATLFTWFITAAGAAVVFLFQSINRKLLDTMLGFAAGVMLAASYWSLLEPAIEMAEQNNLIAWLVVSIGFLAGGFFIKIIDKLLPHLHLGFADNEVEGIKTKWKRSILLVLAITLHNIPEGLAIGVAFGAASIGLKSANITGAIALALGIGLQNFPEGIAVSVPLIREG
ncbi:MAG TPA: ZIP family metal transporter, partial [bacterium]|nr:ZIP family metal transporter [bacterium]